MDDNLRHARFVRAQENAWNAATEFEESRNPTAREKAAQKVDVWCKIVNALRRHS